MSGGTSAPAGWYADPQDDTQLRYWDGGSWTEHRAAKPRPSPPPPPPPPIKQLKPAELVPAFGDRAAEPAITSTEPTDTLSDTRRVPEPPERNRGGLFGSKKALETELDELRALVDSFGYAERSALVEEIQRQRAERDAIAADIAARRTEIAQLDAQLVVAREEVMLQEVGVYDYHHRLEDAGAYRAALDQVRARIKEMSKHDGGAVTAATDWTVNGSKTEGRKMVREFSKLLLRAYNGEADVLVNKLRPYKLDAAIDQLTKSRAVVSRLGGTMHIAITESYHQVRCAELRLTADFLAKKEEEKEAERAEKERLREEAKARKEFEAEKARLLKEQAHYETALQRMRETGTPDEVAAAEQQLAAITEAIHGVEEREANVRAGYVYVISNIGTFGPNVVKIGMTRRLDPYDRVRELGDASVPFRYDIHALVFSDDAVSLEMRLHQAFAQRRVNLVNLRREFFYATPAEVESVLTAADGSVLEFIEEPEAEEWHQSENARRQHTADAQTVLPRA